MLAFLGISLLPIPSSAITTDFTMLCMQQFRVARSSYKSFSISTNSLYEG